ncbi:OmpA family protein [Rurimicrobium arvi]|uniref:OmpA-like domain-containing protein n=1 Tax=Rurimicrobium arvi TaxID=2049916 RepID=A0ABP8MJD4_9BACT
MKNLLRLLLLTIHLSGVLSAYGQSDTLRPPVKCDCAEAVTIAVKGKASYGITDTPRGSGAIQEIRASAFKGSKVFSEEHNSAWYLLDISQGGEMVLDIIPAQLQDDYDFLVFPYRDSATCREIAAGKCKPLRGNLSRNDTSSKGVTGLSGNVSHDFTAEGPGAQFSRSIDVKSGERYLLVLDNVYPDGGGHRIDIKMVRGVNIEGKIVDEEGKPKAGSVTLFDNKGREQLSTTSNAQGFYRMFAKIEENVSYNLVFDADNSFFAVQTINTRDLKNGDSGFANIRTILPALKKGAKYQVGNLNFYGDEARLIPRSLPSLNALYHLMKKNKDMVIQIEGHVNGGMGPGGTVHFQDLSESRAKTVYNFLLRKGIGEERMKTIGYGDQYMLFPKPANEFEQQANRRVEIKVVSID